MFKTHWVGGLKDVLFKIYSVMCNNTKSYICISELWSVCEWCRLYCTYNICSACPDSLICFQFTFLPGDFYHSTLINHRVIYIKAVPRSGSRSHAMVRLSSRQQESDQRQIYTQIFSKTYRGIIMYLKHHNFKCKIYLSSCDPWESNSALCIMIYQSTTQTLLSPLFCRHSLLPYK